MYEKEILEKLNKTIDGVEISPTVLNNIMFEMHEHNMEKKSKRKEKFKFNISLRVKKATAIMAVSILTILCIPTMITHPSKPNANVGSYLEGNAPYQIMVRSNTEEFMPISEIDQYFGGAVSLPLEFNAYKLVNEVVETAPGDSFKIVRLDYTDKTDSNKTIYLSAVITKTGEMPIFSTKTYKGNIGGTMVDMINNGEETVGEISFNKGDVFYNIAYFNTEMEVIESLVQDIIS